MRKLEEQFVFDLSHSLINRLIAGCVQEEWIVRNLNGDLKVQPAAQIKGAFHHFLPEPDHVLGRAEKDDVPDRKVPGAREGTEVRTFVPEHVVLHRERPDGVVCDPGTSLLTVARQAHPRS